MKTLKENRGLQFILFANIAVFVWSAINPFGRDIWWVEMSSVLLVFFVLLGSYFKFQFSNFSYAIVSVWLIMHAIGAHYTFERVPFDFITNLFGFERNHYDRIAHFAIGFNSFCVAEFFFRKNYTCSARVAAFVGVCFIMAMANAWELIEWSYAELDGGEVGAAFLGSQGDVWDAQKDMLCDTLGALCAVPLFLYKFRKTS